MSRQVLAKANIAANSSQLIALQKRTQLFHGFCGDG